MPSQVHSPWARLVEGRAEKWRSDPESFDHILLLNSYNHVESPESLLPTLVDALRPGGTLLVVDDVPFGLCRDSGQGERAEGGPAVFEHHRNHNASHAAALFADLPVDLLRVEDVDASSSNQWTLCCEKNR